MKNLTIASFLFLVFFAGTCSKEAETTETSGEVAVEVSQNKTSDETWKRYPFESAIVEITRTTTNPQFEMKEKIKLYIRKYGLEEARYTDETRNIKMLNMVQSSSSHTIMTEKWLTTIKKGKAIKIPNPAADLVKSMAGKSDEEIESFAEGITDAMDAKTINTGTKEVAGYECKVTKTTSKLGGMESIVTQCTYKKFPLETKSSSMGVEVLERVTSFQIEPDNMPTAPFEVEEGIKVQTIPGF